jgi:L-alanine-DL-glutamate epimerase-like enolase superfamily enzyme
VHLVAATPNAIWVEFFPDTKIFNFMRLLKSSIEVRDGELVLPKDPGLGIELDEKAVERYAVDRWQ